MQGIASISGNKKNAIHCVTGIDVTEPRRMIREHQEKSGIKLSFTASFDHEIVDGGPAARFMEQFTEKVKSGKLLF